jgi:hypothetical protein
MVSIKGRDLGRRLLEPGRVSAQWDERDRDEHDEHDSAQGR